MYEPLWYHNGAGGNVLRADGSVRWYSADAYPEILAGTEAYRAVPATWPSGRKLVLGEGN
jgi:prepilin-type processing-associated H-X9-DG protein